MELVRAVPIVFLAGGIGCFAWAATTGGAAAGVVVIFPFVLGTGPFALLGGLFVAVGLFTLPLAFGSRSVPHSTLPPVPDESPPSGLGGVALIGPVPIFFGSWRHPRRWAYWAAVGAGSVLLLVLLLWELSLLR